MNLKKWETVVEAMLAEVKQEKQPSAGYRIIKAWRTKLEQEPPALQPFQIDEIVREVRRRLDRPHP